MLSTGVIVLILVRSITYVINSAVDSYDNYAAPILLFANAMITVLWGARYARPSYRLPRGLIIAGFDGV